MPSGGKYLTEEEKKGETMEERGKKKGKWSVQDKNICRKGQNRAENEF